MNSGLCVPVLFFLNNNFKICSNDKGWIRNLKIRSWIRNTSFWIRHTAQLCPHCAMRMNTPHLLTNPGIKTTSIAHRQHVLAHQASPAGLWLRAQPRDVAVQVVHFLTPASGTIWKFLRIWATAVVCLGYRLWTKLIKLDLIRSFQNIIISKKKCFKQHRYCYRVLGTTSKQKPELQFSELPVCISLASGPNWSRTATRAHYRIC